MDPIPWDKRARSVDGLGRNLLCKSEDEMGKAAPEQQMNTNFETAAGKGVYTSRRWGKALSYSAPLLYPGQPLLINIVLLVEVPGDLSDHGVGVAHKVEPVLQEKGIRSSRWTRVRFLG